MANTKTTIRTRLKPVRYGLAAFGVVLALFSLVNLFLTFTPVARSNAKIDDTIHNFPALPAAQRAGLLLQLRNRQEANLAEKPSEPYGWARLAYLRFQLTGDPKTAFAALRMSDFVSPFEAPELPERAFMWHQLHIAETPAQQAYEDVLWQNAYGMEREATWDIAVRANLVEFVGNSLKKTSPDLYEEWKARIASKKG